MRMAWCFVSLVTLFNSFPARGKLCHLLISFVNSLDPDQARQNVGPDLDPNSFDTLMVFLKDFFEKVNLKKKKKTQMTKKHAKLPSMQRVKSYQDNEEKIMKGSTQWSIVVISWNPPLAGLELVTAWSKVRSANSSAMQTLLHSQDTITNWRPSVWFLFKSYFSLLTGMLFHCMLHLL